MGESLMQQRRVEDEGLRIVKLLFWVKRKDGTTGISLG
jgi:hypothetical protein